MDSRGSSHGERSSDSRRSRRRTHEIFWRHPTSQLTPPSPPTLDNRAPLHITRARSFASPGQSRIQRHRLRPQREDDTSGTVQDAVNRLNEVNSVLEEPIPQVLGPDDFSGLMEDVESYNRRSKRRKLDSDPLDSHPTISYGYHGQVVPGRLKMVIAGCDGGLYHEDTRGKRLYCQENILRNDKSVYCSKKDSCNLMLKHRGDIAFTVTKIVIKTPDAGFTAP
jgi:hypothetical protein